MTFTVIDKQTNEYPNVEEIALHEEWAKGLTYCDIEGFALGEDGTLMLLDDCGNFAYCPSDRFEIRFKADQSELKAERSICDTCKYHSNNIPCGSTPSACKEADKFAEEFVEGMKNLQIQVEPKQTDLFELMNRFEELCHDIRKQLRQSSAEIASAIRETK